MALIYENVIKNKGESVGEFGDSMFITFGDTAPDTLKDYCYTIEAKPTSGKIEPGQFLVVDNERFKILVVGNIAEKNLVSLGHITVNFTGELESLPGAIVVEKKSCPKIEIGSVIKIEK